MGNSAISTHDFLTDQKLFGSIDPTAESWANWNMIFKAIDGEELSSGQEQLFTLVTGREYKRDPVKTLVLICGRRAGKSINVARLALKEAFSDDHQKHLAPGEKAFVLIVSINLRATRVILDYVRGFLKASPILRAEVERETQHEIHLRNGVVIAVYPCSNVSARGISVRIFIMEEAGHFRPEGAVTDLEVYRSIRPGMATFPNAKVYILTSPYAKSGLVYDFYRDHYGQDDPDILVVKAPSKVMNPTLDDGFLEKEQARDPEAFAREFDAEFAEGISELLPLEAIDACVEWGLFSRPYNSKFQYRAGVDSAGQGAEYFTGAISHKTKEGFELDMIMGWNRQKPEACVERICAALKRYKVDQVTGDRYSAGWVADAFQRRGILYQWAEKTKSEYFLELSPEILQGTVRLLEHKQLLKELRMLERKVSPQGKDTIGHPPRGTDDFANALAISTFEARSENSIGLWIGSAKMV